MTPLPCLEEPAQVPSKRPSGAFPKPGVTAPHRVMKDLGQVGVGQSRASLSHRKQRFSAWVCASALAFG